MLNRLNIQADLASCPLSAAAAVGEAEEKPKVSNLFDGLSKRCELQLSSSSSGSLCGALVASSTSIGRARKSLADSSALLLGSLAS